MYEKQLYSIGNYLSLVLDIKFDIIIENFENDNICSKTDGKNVYVSKKWLENLENDLEIIPAVAHETFHIWQKEAVVYQMIPIDKLLIWEKELIEYFSPECDETKYINQDIEKTATIFSDIILNKLTFLHLDIIDKFAKEDIEFVKSLNFDYHDELFVTEEY